jgi:hypothetical protein
MEEQLPPMFVQWMTLFFFFILWSFLKRRKEALNYTLAERPWANNNNRPQISETSSSFKLSL